MFWPAFGVFIVCLTMESITSWLFIRVSRKKYSSLWRHAGSPTVMGNSDLINAWPLVRFVMRRKYVLEDGAAVAFADRLRFPMVASYIAAVASAIVFFAVLLIEGVPS